MSHDPRFERIRPGLEPEGDAVQRPWVIVLSDWAPDGSFLEQTRNVAAFIDRVFETAESGGAVPLVLVVDDMSRRGWNEAHDRLLADLAEAGAFILQPEGEAEIQAVATDPLAFADEQLRAAMAVVQQPATGPVSAPGGYTEFGKAVTRLSSEELADLIEGRRRDDQWRYEW